MSAVVDDVTPTWASTRIARPPTRRIAVVAVAVGVVGDLALRSGVAGTAGALFVATMAGALLASGRLQTRSSQALVAAAPLFGVWLMIRTSAWLLPFDVLAAFGLLVLGASLSSGGALTDLSWARLAGRTLHAALHGLCAFAFLRPVVPTGRDATAPNRALPLVRGAVLAVPVLAVLGALLASADAVFASFLNVDIDAATLWEHVAAIVFSAWIALGLLRLASARAPEPLPAFGWRLGATEATVVLASVIVLFAMFAAAQVVAAAGGADHVLRTTGLTYAEYARSGFFQLLWVAGLTVAGLLSLRAVAADTGPRFTVLAEAVVGLTLVVVAVAFRRLALYEDAYGLTMLRLHCSVAAVWIGVVVALLGAALAGVGAGKAWLPSAAAAIAMVILFGLNVVNPEAVVVRHNLARPPDRLAVDVDYLDELSDDAVPTLASMLPSVEQETRAAVLAALACPTRDRPDGWAAWNLGVRRADRAHDQLCEAPTG